MFLLFFVRHDGLLVLRCGLWGGMLVSEWIVVAASDGMHHVMIIVATQQEAKIGVLVGGTYLRDKSHNAQTALMDHTTASTLN